MDTRSIERDLLLPAGPNLVFDLLITPSHIRHWWDAASAIVVPKRGGLWVAQWGREDHPDYISAHKITRFEPPRLIELNELTYYARSTMLPFASDMYVIFEVEAVDDGSRLRVTQSGFPTDATADEFYAGCVDGWERTFANIESYVQNLTDG